MNSAIVLIVDDEVEICELVSMYLHAEGCLTHSVHDGAGAVKAVEELRPDLILLDILMPGIDGVEACSRIRAISDAPIIFMSCREEDTDKVIALGVGGDDYLVKPFSMRELVARVKAHLRRRIGDFGKKQLVFGVLKIDLLHHSVTVDGKKIKLSGKEFEILELLAQHPGEVWSPERIFQKLWSQEHNADARTVLVHISNLRKKIERDSTQPNYILTVWGDGYQFNSAWAKDK